VVEKTWDGGHPSEETLRGFADGKLGQDGDVAVEEHLMFGCPDLRCCRYLDSLPNPIDAVMRAIARRYAPGRRRP
jgi:hypothetical protein